MKRDWKKWILAALIRAVRTFAQTFVGFIAVGAALEEIQWLRALSVSGAAFVLSILTSLATGLPEAEDVVLIEPPDENESFLTRSKKKPWERSQGAFFMRSISDGSS